MEPGRLLGGRYRIRSQVGSVRRVWAAYDEDLHKEVTVEKVGARDAARTQWVLRSLTEAASRLRGHPYVVTVYDVVEADGVVWAVLPVVTGPSLADILAHSDRMPAAEVREVARALLAALEAMHEAGVVHGDVRPANIRLGRSGWVLLPGTGARAWADYETTQDNESFAAANYTAPELLRGGPRRPSSDLFSLGATLYHLAAGHAPFHRDSVGATLAAVVAEEPPPLGPIGGLELLIGGLLVKDPDRRLTETEAWEALRGARPVYPRTGAARAGSAAPTADRAAAGYAVLPAGWGLAVALAVALALALAHVSAADISAFFTTLLPWAVFILGVCILAVQARAALARRNSPEVPLWRGYVRSLAPPAPWTDEERGRRRAVAERAVDEALLTVDRRMAAASQDSSRGATDV
ncbi:serine/threonine-protein kinase [Streptomyces sp. NPDC014940]|uniref:serine/threonine-protein kinase n=1 Tax=Streptomyces sp. NPDC014940 TaxID=3364932 RepID=UPI0037010C06